ncbi:hypothetical protein, partial [Loktanella sp. SALINAS62]|uniref:hypothetical protein n=1 Tax=Loktanella sp. SALINAS62 TaxID=2706124 RepID=UPI001B8C85F7
GFEVFLLCVCSIMGNSPRVLPSGKPGAVHAATAIEAQRHLRVALSEVRLELPPSLRYAVDEVGGIPLHVLFEPEKLADADDVAHRLKVLLEEVGGAPVIHHTEEGDPFTVGGSEVGRKIEALLHCVDDVRRHAWRVSDRIKATAALRRCG